MAESLQGIKARKKAVTNISQITKAMEVVSATKMRKAQEVALNSRPYAWKALELLKKIKEHATIAIPLTAPREVKKTLLVIVSSDRGLAGSFNSQVFRGADEFLKIRARENISCVVVGKKALAHAKKKRLTILQSFTGVGDYILPSQVRPIVELLIQGFERGDFDEVITISTHFRTTLKQEVLTRQILPVTIERIWEAIDAIIPEHGRYAEFRGDRPGEKNIKGEVEYIFEPSPEEALKALVPHLVETQIYDVILEANASEHSARRVAMKNATDNADEISEVLTLSYNKARQASITNELIEITSTQNALS